MEDLTIGGVEYRLTAFSRDGVWTAHAERRATGDRFGVECAGPTEKAATERLSRWLTWQHEHSKALEALQQAQRAYHRAFADGAFGGQQEESIASDLQRTSLEEIEAARVRLDEVRARRPE